MDRSAAAQVEKLQPERRRRGTTSLYAPGCCACCCCCCLHSVGGIIGALVGREIRREKAPVVYTYRVDENNNVIPSPVDPGVSADILFWRILLPLPVVFFGLLFWLKDGCTAIFLAIIYLPYLQMVSAGITFAVLGVSRRADKNYQIRQLAKVTAGAIVGTVSGLLIMLPCLGIGWHEFYQLTGMQFVFELFSK
jgi:hypothetical protein